MNQGAAIAKINKNGILLVFPVNNQKDPKSLWSEFYPKAKLIWKWDEDGDNRVSDLWHLMKRLSENKKVVYSKWYRNRATFFSIDLFTALLCNYRKNIHPHLRLSRSAKEILEALESDSPLSTKQLKKLTDLRGKQNEATYNKSMKELFSTLHIVAFGEVDDGAFPSLAVGATQVLYEDLWVNAGLMDINQAQKIIDLYLKPGQFKKYYCGGVLKN